MYARKQAYADKSLAMHQDNFSSCGELRCVKAMLEACRPPQLCSKAPNILVVDDANYMDTLSWELLDKFGQLTSQYPCIVAMTSIPHSERVQQPQPIVRVMAKSVLVVEIQPLGKEFIPDFVFQRLRVKGVHNQILRYASVGTVPSNRGQGIRRGFCRGELETLLLRFLCF
ncbi:hypothetical protein HPB48_020332 [Haemaphysalis longicornis]|uniref:Uncharacterized protein n=1 Tax=Haemaphysalis longicornis TaxID=44386 RepID=A0A9J6GS20_HAELO|nr:hypothetical protein HPB48_020332 [Haemaphysalis longicornis]